MASVDRMPFLCLSNSKNYIIFVPKIFKINAIIKSF